MDLGIYIFWLLLRIDMLVDILLQKNYYWNVRFPSTCVSLDELQLERNVTFKSDAEGAPFVKRETDDISILCSGINHPDVLSGWRTGSIIYLNLLKRPRKWRIIIDPCTEMYADSIVGFCAVKSVLLYAPYHSKPVPLLLGSAPLHVGLKLNKPIQNIRKSHDSIDKTYFKS